MPDGTKIQMQVFTLAVNAHGGLLEFHVKLNAGQNMSLFNSATREEVNCTVFYVKGTSGTTYEVAFEFDRRSPQFWPVSSPPEDWKTREESKR